MIGGIEETSASFEARSAPRSYPTPIIGHRTRRLVLIHDLLKRLDPMAVAILLLVAGFRMGARVLINDTNGPNL